MKLIVGKNATFGDAVTDQVKDLGKDFAKWLSGALADAKALEGSSLYRAAQFAHFINNWILGDPLNMDGLDLIDQTLSALGTIDKIFGNFMSEFIQKYTGFAGVVGKVGGAVGDIIGLYKDIDATSTKMKALATIYNSGSVGTLYVKKFGAMINGGEADKLEFQMYAEMGMFSGLEGQTKDLIAAYLLAAGLK